MNAMFIDALKMAVEAQRDTISKAEYELATCAATATVRFLVEAQLEKQRNGLAVLVDYIQRYEEKK